MTDDDSGTVPAGAERMRSLIVDNLNAAVTDRPKLTLLQGGKPHTKAYEHSTLPTSELITVSAMSNGTVRVIDDAGHGWELDPMLALNVSMQMQAMSYYFLDQYFAAVRSQGVTVSQKPKIDIVRGSLPKNLR